MRRVLTVLLALAAVLPACGGDSPGPRPTVAASFFPLTEVARAVAGDDADVIDLAPAGQDPHGLTELTATAIAGADVLVHIGQGFQPAVDELAGSFDGAVVDALQGLPIVEDDVHVWLDPTMLTRAVSGVRDALAKADPDNAETYATNAARFQRTLRALDNRLARGLATCDRNVIVSAHAAWRYFTSRYRLEQEPLAGVSPGEPPAPARPGELAALIRDAGVTTVFREPLVPEAPVVALAAATGVEIATLDPLEGRVETGPGGTYVEQMGRNLTALRAALGCS